MRHSSLGRFFHFVRETIINKKLNSKQQHQNKNHSSTTREKYDFFLWTCDLHITWLLAKSWIQMKFYIHSVCYWYLLFVVISQKIKKSEQSKRIWMCNSKNKYLIFIPKLKVSKKFVKNCWCRLKTIRIHLEIFWTF